MTRDRPLLPSLIAGLFSDVVATAEYTWGFSASLPSSLDNEGAEMLAAYEASVRQEEERIAEERAAEARAYAMGRWE